MSEHFVDLLSAERNREYRESLIHGVVVGIVTNLKDPEKLGRIKVKFPWLDDKEESHWARVVPFMAGKGRGCWILPEVGDEVLLSFEHGNIHFPYIMGHLWNGKDVPPVADDITAGMSSGASYSPKGPAADEAHGDNDLRFLRSRSGHLIILDDKKSNERIVIVDKSGKNHFQIITKGSGGGYTGSDKGKIIITSEDGDIEMYAPKGMIYMKAKDIETLSTKTTLMVAKDTFDAKADKDMTLFTKMNFKGEAKVKMDLKAGAAGTYKAGATMLIESSAPLTVKSGATMDVKASAIITIKGALVKIN